MTRDSDGGWLTAAEQPRREQVRSTAELIELDREERALTDPALWGAHHDLTGPAPMSWPEALDLLSAELGEPVTFWVAAEREVLARLIGAGVPAGDAELLITREWAILAGENDYTTGTFQQIAGRPPRSVAECLHDYRAEFV